MEQRTKGGRGMYKDKQLQMIRICKTPTAESKAKHTGDTGQAYDGNELGG